MKSNSWIRFNRIGPISVVLSILVASGCDNRKLPVYFAEDSVEVNGQYKITSAKEIPAFRFQSQLGRPLTNKDLAGAVYVADFFFTRCPGICKDMGSQMMRIQEKFKDKEEVKMLSFTVDPEHDDVPSLMSYATLHQAEPGKWFFLTGSKDSIYAIAKTGYLLNALEDKNHPDEFIHDNHFVLIDKKGWIRGFYDGTDPKDVDRLINDIPVLLKEYDN